MSTNTATLPVGRYAYDQVDRTFLSQRVAQFRAQVNRRIAGDLSEDEFKPLRLMNGLYLQLHAYMLRVAIPYGMLGSDQMRELAHIARTYDRDYGHFTTRQNMQFNWIRLEDTPDILQRLADVDMHAIQTSGNCIRNVTCDEFAGAAADELLDPRIHAEILRQWSTLHPEFSFLPRKFKIAISGSPQDRVAARFHDIGLVARPGAQDRPVFDVFVGGGLGRTPVIGVLLRDNLPEEDLVAYLEAIVRVYNAYGRRDNMYKARIKILVQALGVETFREKVDAEFALMNRADYRLDPAIVDGIRARFGIPALDAPADAADTLAAARGTDARFDRWVRTNTHPHRHEGFISVVISVKPDGGIPGDVTADQMDLIADLADGWSFGEIRVTHMQNVVLGHVRKDRLHELWQKLVAAGLGTPNIGLIGDIIACPGLDYCSLANARSIPIAQKLSARFADPELQENIGKLHINISGCINACGHHHAGHIGILGVDKRGEEFFQLTLGGSASNDVAIGQIIGPALPEDETVDAIARLVDAYLVLRNEGEEFIDTYRRLGAASFKDAVYALLENGRIAEDRWVEAVDGAPLPDGAVIVPFARLEEGLARTGTAPLGVAIEPDMAVEQLRVALPRLGLVAVTFGSFRDGRAFTQARALREHLSFDGEIRAMGKPLPDQYEFMLRCGITTVKTERPEDVTVWQQAHEMFSVAYQPSTLHERPQGLGLRRFLS